MELTPFPARLTSRRIPATRLTCGIPRSLSSGCPKSTSRGGWKLGIAARTSRILPAGGGITPPGGNNGSPQYYTCMSGASAGTSDLPTAEANCGGGMGSVWFPDLRKTQGARQRGRHGEILGVHRPKGSQRHLLASLPNTDAALRTTKSFVSSASR